MENIKRNLGIAASNLIENNSIVGLGTGTTTKYFIEALAKRCQKNLNIVAVSSSEESFKLAKKLNIDVKNENDVDHIDVYVDGADEVDFSKNMIKGKGAALLREKILASFSKKVIIIIDHTKYVKNLGKVLLPVEIVPFGCKLTKMKLEKLGYFGEFRKSKTDNGNYILDVKLTHLLDDPQIHHETIKNIPGVVETGLFIDLADDIIIGYPDSKIEIIS
ncbi:MAG: ribose-5-phosphate isomerase RpiA [Parachlamydiales bacterium]|nr:ribose-5-phosphate isomerase RpiA [Parachlamydiales bacterium]